MVRNVLGLAAVLLIGAAAAATAGEPRLAPVVARCGDCDVGHAIGCCPDRYCRKPAPCVVRPRTLCGDAYCRKPAPCVERPKITCSDDYCRKPSPPWCWKPSPGAKCLTCNDAGVRPTAR